MIYDQDFMQESLKITSKKELVTSFFEVVFNSASSSVEKLFFNRHLIYDLYNFSLCFVEESLSLQKIIADLGIHGVQIGALKSSGQL